MSFYITDDVHDIGFVRPLPFFIDNRQVCFQRFRICTGPLHASCIRRDHAEVIHELVLDIVQHDRLCIQIINRDIEESLNLACMEVHGQHPVRPCRP